MQLASSESMPRSVGHEVFGFSCDARLVTLPLAQLSDQHIQIGRPESRVRCCCYRTLGALNESVVLGEWLAEYGHGIPDRRL